MHNIPTQNLMRNWTLYKNATSNKLFWRKNCHNFRLTNELSPNSRMFQVFQDICVPEMDEYIYFISKKINKANDLIFFLLSLVYEFLRERSKYKRILCAYFLAIYFNINETQSWFFDNDTVSRQKIRPFIHRFIYQNQYLIDRIHYSH